MEGAPRTLVERQDRPGAVMLRLDGGETLEIAPESIPEDLPDVGGSIRSPLLDLLREAAARKQVARDLMLLLDRKLWTTQRLRRKLLEAGHAELAVDAVIAQAEAKGLHSDAGFAAAFCRDALRRKAVGRSWLEAKLREKGVPSGLAAAAAAEELPDEQERELAERAAASRWRRERSVDARAIARVQRFLASRGFAPGLASRAARATRPADPDPDSSCNSDDEGPS